MFILGDTHGNFTYLRYLINTIGKKGPIIQVGDFGMNNNVNPMEALLYGLNKLLGEIGTKLYVIRGNHDNPYFWQGNHIYENIHRYRITCRRNSSRGSEREVRFRQNSLLRAFHVLHGRFKKIF